MFGKHLFDFDETDVFLNEMKMSMIHSLNLENDLANCNHMFKARTIDTGALIRCLYPTDGITSMYCIVLAHVDQKNKTKKTAKNLMTAMGQTVTCQLHLPIVQFMFCFLYDGKEKEYLMATLSRMSFSAKQSSRLLTVIAWAKIYNPAWIDNQIVNAVMQKIQDLHKREKVAYNLDDMIISLKDIPFPRWMVKDGFKNFFSNPPKMVHDLPKTFRDYVEEEKYSFSKVTTCTVQEKISVFKLSVQSSEDIFMRALARIYLENEKYSKLKNPRLYEKYMKNLKSHSHVDFHVEKENLELNSHKLQDLTFEEFLAVGRKAAGFKNSTKRKMSKLLDGPGRVSLDVCRCPLVWKLMLNCEKSPTFIRDCHLIGQKFVGWSKSFQMKYLDMIKKSETSDEDLLTTIFMCREIGIRLRTLPEECAIYKYASESS